MVSGPTGALHPRSVGELLDAAARLYLGRFGTLFLVALASSLLVWVLDTLGAHRVPRAGMPTLALLTNGGRLPNPLLALLASGVQLVAYGTLIGVAAGAMLQAQAPEDPTGALRRTLRRFWPLLLVTVVVLVLGAIGMVLLLVPGILLFTWWAVSGPVVVLEDHPPLRVLGRSRSLVQGYFWHTLGTVVLAQLLGLAAMALLGTVGTPLAAVRGRGGITLFDLWTVGVQALIMPYAVCTITLLYYDLRCRKEGLDLLAPRSWPPAEV